MGSAFLGSIIGGMIPEIAGRIASVSPKGVFATQGYSSHFSAVYHNLNHPYDVVEGGAQS